jgi:hypothetical protein
MLIEKGGRTTRARYGMRQEHYVQFMPLEKANYQRHDDYLFNINGL